MVSANMYRRPIVAAIAASSLMLIFGLTYRVLAARLGVPTSATPIAQGVTEQFPLQFSDWTGQDMPLDDAIVRGTSTDAHISRRYSRANGLESVSLYVACGVRKNEIVYHQPNVCYPGAGWTLVEQHSLDLPLSEGNKLPCTIFQFARNELYKERVTVLHYWIADGRFYRDVSPLRLRLWRLSEKVDFIAQVQIIASSGGPITPDAMIKKIISDFAVDSASSIAELFEHAGEKRTEDKKARR